MSEKKVTLYDLKKMCKQIDICSSCPLFTKNNGRNMPCGDMILTYTDEANTIVLDWFETHSKKIRQDEFLKLFPNVKMIAGTVIDICPKTINKDFICTDTMLCDICKKNYWFEKVNENE